MDEETIGMWLVTFDSRCAEIEVQIVGDDLIRNQR